MFPEFGKNVIHKDHTFVFPLNSQLYGEWGDYCYFMNGKEYVKFKDEDQSDYDGSLRSMRILNKDTIIKDYKLNKDSSIQDVKSKKVLFENFNLIYNL